MGGKKKTKWKKVPPEELSHITVKRSIDERLKTKEQYYSNKFITKTANNDTRLQQPLIPFNNQGFTTQEKFEVNGSSDGNSHNQKASNNTSSEQSGYYINGLWMPQLQVNQLHHNINKPSDSLQPVQLVLQHPFTYFPTSHPTFHSLSGHDISPYRNNFIPSDSHYLYYFMNLQSRRPSSEFIKEESNSSSSFEHLQPLTDYPPLPDQMPATDTDVPPKLQNNFEQHGKQNTSVMEGYDDIVHTYQYPGQGFGQATYNIPLYPVISPNVQLQTTESWNITRFQKQKRQKRKAYAEYAIIPSTKDTSKQFKDKTKFFTKNYIKKSTSQIKDDSYEEIKNKFVSFGQENNEKDNIDVLQVKTKIQTPPHKRQVINDIPIAQKVNDLACVKIKCKNELNSANCNTGIQENTKLSTKEKISINKCLVDKMEISSDTCIENNKKSNCVSAKGFFQQRTQNLKDEKLKNIACLHISSNYEMDDHDINENSITGEHLVGDQIINNNSIKHGVKKLSLEGERYDTINQKINSPITSAFHTADICTDIEKLASNNDMTNLQIAKHELNRRRYFNNVLSKESDDGEIKTDSLTPQSSYMSLMVSSEVLIRETELELNKLHQLTSKSSLQENQTIYKLAYDENVTDHSESEVEDTNNQLEYNKQKQICPQACRNIQNDIVRSEILVHEADSASDAGSEDVELLPHRYASDCAQICNKHVYVNNLSLAVEMLRTQENLPYDEEFKRIVDDNYDNKNELLDCGLLSHSKKHSTGMVNPGYAEGHSCNHKLRTVTQSSENINVISSNTECWTIAMDDSIKIENLSDEIGQEVDEILFNEPIAYDEQKQPNIKHEGNANLRRLGNQARQQFSIYTPHTSIVNPCLCCIVM